MGCLDAIIIVVFIFLAGWALFDYLFKRDESSGPAVGEPKKPKRG